jgi:hypothetical protein
MAVAHNRFCRAAALSSSPFTASALFPEPGKNGVVVENGEKWKKMAFALL